MRRHYIFLPNQLREYALQAGATDSDWAKSIFDDITENATKLTVIPLGANERGERIGLCGDRFFCQAGVDMNREDCLFVFRVERADENLPTSIPVRYAGEYRPLPARRTGIPVLDPVADLFGEDKKPTVAPPPAPVQSTLSSLAAEIIGQASENLRVLWRPGRQLIRHDAADEFLAHIRRPWIRFRLDQYAHPTPRQDGLIKYLMRPQALSQSDRDGLLHLFGLELINLEQGRAFKQPFI